MRFDICVRAGQGIPPLGAVKSEPARARMSVSHGVRVLNTNHSLFCFLLYCGRPLTRMITRKVPCRVELHTDSKNACYASLENTCTWTGPRATNKCRPPIGVGLVTQSRQGAPLLTDIPTRQCSAPIVPVGKPVKQFFF